MPQKGSKAKANNKITMTYAEALRAWKAMAVPITDGNGTVVGEPLIQRKKMDVVRVKVPFRRFFRELEQHRQDFIKHQEDIIKEFVDSQEDLNSEEHPTLEFLVKNYTDFEEQYRELLDTEVDVSGNPIRPEVFEGADVTILDLEMLGPLVDL